eukprot:TRINITY_DN115_c0_g1_i15.p1 TRINITY_DN115_c0_g1~~TRINITY_DN115_c0_g1_i15.p1  ORF type:complete len:405 (-),score=119.08 TRINITY_DN115_c0_g1_i15:1046-2260(-)
MCIRDRVSTQSTWDIKKEPMVDRVMRTRLARLLGYMGLRNQVVFGYKRSRRVQPLINIGGVDMYDPAQKIDRKKAMEFAREEFSWKQNSSQYHDESTASDADQTNPSAKQEENKREKKNIIYINPDTIKVRLKSPKERQYSRQRMKEIMEYFKTSRVTETQLKMRNALLEEEKAKIKQKMGIMDDKELETKLKEKLTTDIKRVLPEGVKLEDLIKQDEESERPEGQFIENMGKREDPKEQYKLYEEYMKKKKEIQNKEDEESQEDVPRDKRGLELGKEEKMSSFQEESDMEFNVLLPHTESIRSTDMDEEEKSSEDYDLESIMSRHKIAKAVKLKLKNEKAVVKRREELAAARMKKKMGSEAESGDELGEYEDEELFSDEQKEEKEEKKRQKHRSKYRKKYRRY